MRQNLCKYSPYQSISDSQKHAASKNTKYFVMILWLYKELWSFIGMRHYVTQHPTESQVSKSAPPPICPQTDNLPSAVTRSSLCPHTTVGSIFWEARWGRCGAASDQSELELCVTCKGEAPECDNSCVLKWGFSAWGERNRWQRDCSLLWKESTPFVDSFKTETCYPPVFPIKTANSSAVPLVSK